MARRHGVSRPQRVDAAGTRTTDALGKSPSSSQSSDKNPAPKLVSVYSGQTLLGFVLSRGRDDFESFDAQERSIGVFPDMQQAADAIGGGGVVTSGRDCEGKKRYLTFELAQAAAYIQRDYDETARVHVYRCRQCQHWHIGNSKPRRPMRAHRGACRPLGIAMQRCANST